MAKWLVIEILENETEVDILKKLNERTDIYPDRNSQDEMIIMWNVYGYSEAAIGRLKSKIELEIKGEISYEWTIIE